MEEYLKNVNESKNFYTVAGYFKFLEERFDIERPIVGERKNIYKSTGLMCASLCDERDIIVERENHPEFRYINKYPENIIAEVIFGEAYQEFFPLYSPYLNRRYPCVPRKNTR